VEIDGQMAGWVQSIAGGHATSDVVTEKVGAAPYKVAPDKVGPDNIQKKHVANVKYEDITVNCGTGMSRNFYDWIKASFDHQYSRKNGAVITADYNGKEVTRLDWFNGLITEVGFPALDGASKDAAKMSIKISPETTRMTAHSGGSMGRTYKNDQTIQKKWLPANFRLQIDGLDCSRVNKIEAITVKLAPAGNQVGVERAISGVPPQLQVSNLLVTLAETHAAAFYKWHQDMMIKIKDQSTNERRGTLAYLTANLQEAIFTLTFRGLGILKLTPEKVEAGSENIRRVKAEMYCRDIGFVHAPTAWA
jgi:phage tail-like protein